MESSGDQKGVAPTDAPANAGAAVQELHTVLGQAQSATAPSAAASPSSSSAASAKSASPLADASAPALTLHDTIGSCKVYSPIRNIGDEHLCAVSMVERGAPPPAAAADGGASSAAKEETAVVAADDAKYLKVQPGDEVQTAGGAGRAYLNNRQLRVGALLVKTDKAGRHVQVVLVDLKKSKVYEPQPLTVIEHNISSSDKSGGGGGGGGGVSSTMSAVDDEKLQALMKEWEVGAAAKHLKTHLSADDHQLRYNLHAPHPPTRYDQEAEEKRQQQQAAAKVKRKRKQPPTHKPAGAPPPTRVKAQHPSPAASVAAPTAHSPATAATDRASAAPIITEAPTPMEDDGPTNEAQMVPHRASTLAPQLATFNSTLQSLFGGGGGGGGGFGSFGGFGGFGFGGFGDGGGSLPTAVATQIMRLQAAHQAAAYREQQLAQDLENERQSHEADRRAEADRARHAREQAAQQQQQQLNMQYAMLAMSQQSWPAAPSQRQPPPPRR